jgi:hypothetical protein
VGELNHGIPRIHGMLTMVGRDVPIAPKL